MIRRPEFRALPFMFAIIATPVLAADASATGVHGARGQHHAGSTQPKAVYGTDGRWVYDGKKPPSCNDRDRRVRHFHGDGHTTGHDHLGKNYKWNQRNFKGYLTKPPCYIRRADSPVAPARSDADGFGGERS